jgi:hypothetical protein
VDRYDSVKAALLQRPIQEPVTVQQETRRELRQAYAPGEDRVHNLVSD